MTPQQAAHRGTIPEAAWREWALGLKPESCDWCGAMACGCDPDTGEHLPYFGDYQPPLLPEPERRAL